MSDPLADAVLSLVDAHAEAGVPMGKLVDRLVADGGNEQHVQLGIRQLIQQRRLSPSGFVCRKVRKPNHNGPGVETRTYEFVLVPWSPALDAQLELDLGDTVESGHSSSVSSSGR